MYDCILMHDIILVILDILGYLIYSYAFIRYLAMTSPSGDY